MSQTFQLNGQTLEYVTGANWEEVPTGAALDGVTVRNRHRRHRWQTNVMPATEFETIRGELGKTVSLMTTDYDALNCNYVTYYGATLDRVNGEHAGPVYVGVMAEFMVRV